MKIPMLEVPAHDEHWYVRTKTGVVPYSRYTGKKVAPEKLYASVTTIIGGGVPKPFPYLKWLGDSVSYDAAMEYTARRAVEGTNVHDAMEHMELNPMKNIPREMYTPTEWDMIYGLFRGLQSLGVSMKDIDPAMVEMVVYDDDDRTAGTLDLRVCIGGEWWVIDYKTSKLIKIEHKIQVMKYGTMCIKRGLPVDRVCVMRSAPKAKDGFDYWDGKIDPTYLSAFDNARQMFWFLNPKAGPKMKSVPEHLSLSYL